ncbi:unnamed protein product, partial [marine sediment metagenome]
MFNTGQIKVGQVIMPQRIYPEDRFVYSDRVEPSLVQLAKNEYEDMQFVVDFTREEDATALEVSLSPIVNKNGMSLENVQLREQIYLTTTIPSRFGAYPIGQYPGPLFKAGWRKVIPNAPITKKNNEISRKSRRRTFMIIAKAPRDATAGEYKGTVSLKLNGRVSTLSVIYEVYNFALPKRAHYRGDTGMVGFGEKKWAANARIMELSDDYIARVEKEKSMLVRHRELCLEYGWTP